MKKDGKLLKTKFVTDHIYTLYVLYGFHVELVYDETIKEIIKIGPLPSSNWVLFYS